jgi:Glycosyltransferases, probably involved in cell wall biogenesis
LKVSLLPWVMMNDMVSIIMPMRDAGLFIRSCIESIIAQDYDLWELVVVDDHSSDDSAILVGRYVPQDHRIKLINTEGRGIIDALHTGYKISSGQWITRMDADDLMAPGRLSEMVTVLRSQGGGALAVGLVSYFRTDGLGGGYQRYERWLNLLTERSENFANIYRECSIPSPCWMLRRSDFDRIGGFESDRYPEDYDLAFRMYKAQLKVIGIPKVLHRWRDHEHRASRNDPNYEDNQFAQMKVDYFLDLDRDLSLPLIIWGAGSKGKALVTVLLAAGQKLAWVTNNIKKIDQEIYGVRLQSEELLDQAPKGQVIVAISAPDALAKIADIIDDYTGRLSFYRFC